MRAAMGPACCGLSRSLSLPSDSPELRIKPRNIKGGGWKGHIQTLSPAPKEGRAWLCASKRPKSSLNPDPSHPQGAELSILERQGQGLLAKPGLLS